MGRPRRNRKKDPEEKQMKDGGKRLSKHGVSMHYVEEQITIRKGTTSGRRTIGMHLSLQKMMEMMMMQSIMTILQSFQ